MENTNLRLLSLFSGIGAFEKGLERMDIPYELAGFSEIDKRAIQSYCAIHNVEESLNLGDVSQIRNEDLPQNIDMITYGFPCQDISIAGHQKGITDNTRSGLLFEAERIIEHTKPKFAIAENVKNLVSKKFKDDFDALLNRLDSYGYNNYWRVLNAKDYGVPQNRERVFIVSVRKDVDTGVFQFPEKQKLDTKLKDILLDEFEDKYIIRNDKANQLLKIILNTNNVNGGECADATINNPTIKDIANCITARYDSGIQNRKGIGTVVIEPELNRLGGWNDTTDRKRQSGEVYGVDGLSPTLNTMQGGAREPHIIVKEGIKDVTQQRVTDMEKYYLPKDSNDYANYDKSKVDKNIVKLNPIQIGSSRSFGNAVSNNEYAYTIRASQPNGILDEHYRIRKLTPLECWRLMGFDDEDYWNARARLEEVFYKGKDRSNSQMYKQAGNSIVVNVIEQIYQEMHKARLL